MAGSSATCAATASTASGWRTSSTWWATSAPFIAVARISAEETFGSKESILVLSMAVVGGLGSVPGAVLAALYLIGLPLLLGSTATVQFITSGFGVLAFLLYLPGGLGALAGRAGDGIAALIERRRQGEPPTDATVDDVEVDEITPELAGAGAPAGGDT